MVQRCLEPLQVALPDRTHAVPPRCGLHLASFKSAHPVNVKFNRAVSTAVSCGHNEHQLGACQPECFSPRNFSTLWLRIRPLRPLVRHLLLDVVLPPQRPPSSTPTRSLHPSRARPRLPSARSVTAALPLRPRMNMRHLRRGAYLVTSTASVQEGSIQVQARTVGSCNVGVTFGQACISKNGFLCRVPRRALLMPSPVTGTVVIFRFNNQVDLVELPGGAAGSR